MQVERLVPDPDATFGSLGRDPLSANLPESHRSAVDPVVLLPPFNESCGTIPSKCLVGVAVRARIKLVELTTFHIVQVFRRILLRPRTDE